MYSSDTTNINIALYSSPKRKRPLSRPPARGRRAGVRAACAQRKRADCTLCSVPIARCAACRLHAVHCAGHCPHRNMICICI